MTVTEIQGQWFVTEGDRKAISGLQSLSDDRLVGPFQTNSAAWAWIDQRDSEHSELVDRNARIRNAFAER